MKNFLSILTALVLTLAGNAEAQTLTGSYGTGADTSYLVIQASEFEPVSLVYAYHYDYDVENPLNSYDLLTAIVAGDPLLDATYINYGDLEAPNYFLNSLTYGGVTLTNTPSPTFAPYWVQWVSGGESGYPEAEPIAGGTWVFGSGLSAPYRYLTPGSWDGFIYNDGFTAPDMAPVPEPHSWLLIIVAGGILFHLTRRPSCVA